MTLREMYEDIGADYDQVVARLGGSRGEKLLGKLIAMLPEDSTVADLKTALAKKDYKTAFRAAHTYKGVVLNLGLNPLFDTVNELTEQLRTEKDEAQILQLLQELEHRNEKIIQDIHKLTQE